jgi:fructose-1,6-bisphosphatase/inositol monophosphatase family enzyme
MKFNPKVMIWTFGAMFLEFFGRFLGAYDIYIKKKNPYIWDIAGSTKK